MKKPIERFKTNLPGRIVLNITHTQLVDGTDRLMYSDICLPALFLTTKQYVYRDKQNPIQENQRCFVFGILDKSSGNGFIGILKI